MVHEVAVEVFHGAVTVVGVACDNRAIRAIPATQTVANIGYITQQSQEPLLISSILDKIIGTVMHLSSSFREAEFKTISYVARPHHQRQSYMLKRRLQQRSSSNNRY